MALYITIRKNLLNSAIILILVPCCNTKKKKQSQKQTKKHQPNSQPTDKNKKVWKNDGKKDILSHFHIFYKKNYNISTGTRNKFKGLKGDFIFPPSVFQKSLIFPVKGYENSYSVHSFHTEHLTASAYICAGEG